MGDTVPKVEGIKQESSEILSVKNGGRTGRFPDFKKLFVDLTHGNREQHNFRLCLTSSDCGS